MNRNILLFFVGNTKPNWGQTKKKERLPFWQAFLKESTLDGTGNLAGAEAPSTYVDMAGSTVDQSLYATNVRLPGSVRTSVGVGNLDTKGNALAANIALCHFPAPPYLKGIE